MQRRHCIAFLGFDDLTDHLVVQAAQGRPRPYRTADNPTSPLAPPTRPTSCDAIPPRAAGGYVVTAPTRLDDVTVAGPDHRSASKVTAEELGALMFTNAASPIRLARSLIANVRLGSGVVAFTSSVMGSVAVNPGGHELYRASKAALNSLARGLWGELQGRQLTMVSLHPGWVRTDMAGPTAPVSVEDSAAGIVSVIEAQSGAHQHRFLDYQGKSLPW